MSGFVRSSGKGTAGLRSIESSSGENALIHDKVAQHFAGDVGSEWANSLREPTRSNMIDLLAVRTRTIDDIIEVLIAEGEYQSEKWPLREIDEKIGALSRRSRDYKQIVNLGAGYDTRPFRLNGLSRSTFFELDYREVVMEKERLLKVNGIVPLCRRYVPFAADIASIGLGIGLKTNGFEEKLATIWIMEGVSGYLSSAENQSLVGEITALSAPGSIIVATFVGETREAYGPGTGPSPKHVYFTNSGDQLVSSFGWLTCQARVDYFARLYGRTKCLDNFDYWVVVGIK